jgi:prevent-host-death family protein
MNIDHGQQARYHMYMEIVSVSRFKATCLELLARVKRTGQPILITRRGVPIAEVVPPRAEERPKSWLGSLRGTGKIVGDVVSPSSDESEWEALKP